MTIASSSWRAQPEDLGLLAGGGGLVGHLQRAQPEIGGVGEHLAVLGVVPLAPVERLLEPAAALERGRQQVVDLELVLPRLSVRSDMSSAACSTEIASTSAPRRSATRPSATITPSWARVARLAAVIGTFLGHTRRASAKHSAACWRSARPM